MRQVTNLDVSCVCVLFFSNNLSNAFHACHIYTIHPYHTMRTAFMMIETCNKLIRFVSRIQTHSFSHLLKFLGVVFLCCLITLLSRVHDFPFNCDCCYTFMGHKQHRNRMKSIMLILFRIHWVWSEQWQFPILVHNFLKDKSVWMISCASIHLCRVEYRMAVSEWVNNISVYVCFCAIRSFICSRWLFTMMRSWKFVARKWHWH